MANVNIIADFETSLASKIAVGGTTGSLVSNVDDDGNTLPDGLFNLTLDGNNSSKEHILCTKTGVNLTAIETVSRQGVKAYGVVREHRVGAKVVMTDFSTFKDYIDNIAIQGSVSATEALQGVALLSVPAVAPTVPIVIGQNDPILPTTNEKAALAGGSTLGAPSTSNKFLTQAVTSSATYLPIIQTYLIASSPATWSKPAGLKYVIVEVQAGGGGGGGCQGDDSGASGGGGGGYSKKIIPTSSLGATETVTIGAGGTGGPSNGETAGTGGTSSFGSHCSATGGTGGAEQSGPGAGGAGSNGNVNLTGSYGGVPETTYSGSSTKYGAAAGGASFLGGTSSSALPQANTTVGTTGISYGGGGSGSSSDSYDAVSGSAGAPGIVIVTEYYL